jgi:hypothetical protein
MGKVRCYTHGMKAAVTAYRRTTLHIAVFAALTGYFAALCVYFSNRRMMWPDEFDGWNLLTDPSWHHMEDCYFPLLAIMF